MNRYAIVKGYAQEVENSLNSDFATGWEVVQMTQDGDIICILLERDISDVSPNGSFKPNLMLIDSDKLADGRGWN